MNLTLHLVRKDLRHFRVLALIWAILVLAAVVLTQQLLAAEAGDSAWYLPMCGYVNLVYLLNVIVAFLLGGVVVLADPPAGSVAHWQTRPISGGRLLAAKFTTGVILIGIVPVLVWLPWWLRQGFGAAGMAGAATNVLLVVLIPALVGAGLAAVVDHLGRFLLLAVIAAMALVAFGMWALVPRTISQDLFNTRLLLALVCLVATALLAAVVQYVTRRAIAARAIWIGGIAVILLVRGWWPVDLSPVWNETPGTLAGAEQVNGRIWHAQLGTQHNSHGETEPVVLLSIGLTGVPADLFVSGGTADVELSWPDGTTVRREKLWLGGDKSNRMPSLRRALGFASPPDSWPRHWDPETQAKYEAVKSATDRRLLEPRHGRHTQGGGRTIPPDLAASLRCEVPVSSAIATKLRTTPPVCRVTAEFWTARSVIVGETSLRAGAAIVGDGRVRVATLQRVDATRNHPEELDFRYVGALTVARPPYGRGRSFYLVDRAHESVSWHLSYQTAQGIPPLAAAVLYHPFDLPPPSVWRGDRWQEISNWQQTFVLVEESSVPAGNFRYALTAERLEIAAPAAD